jgi:polyhydroxybutyrate depolymerase
MKLCRACWMGILAALLATIFVAFPARAQDHEETVKVNGFPRTCLVHLPAGYTAGNRYPVVVVLHGLGGDASVVARLTHFNETADKFGFIAVYPNANYGRWTSPELSSGGPIFGSRRRGLEFPGDSSGGQDREVGGKPANDIPFFENLLDQIESEYSVDTSRVYVTGYSDGGFMVFRLGCELATRFAAVATVGATLPAYLGESCSDWAWRAVSLLMIHGTSDPAVDYMGNPAFTVRYPFLAAKDSVKLWARMNNCGSKPEKTTLPRRTSGGLETRVETYTDCSAGSAVQLYSVVKGGHTWPGGNQYFPERRVGRASTDFDATEVIWQFFAAHPMPTAKK